MGRLFLHDYPSIEQMLVYKEQGLSVNDVSAITGIPQKLVTEHCRRTGVRFVFKKRCTPRNVKFHQMLELGYSVETSRVVAETYELATENDLSYRQRRAWIRAFGKIEKEKAKEKAKKEKRDPEAIVVRKLKSFDLSKDIEYFSEKHPVMVKPWNSQLFGENNESINCM